MALTTDCEAYYKLDTNNTTQPDATGNGNSGTISGATYTASGKINGAYDFDGVNDYLTIPSSINTQITGSPAFTISMWIKRDNINNDSLPFSISQSGSGRVSLYINSSNQLRLGGRSQDSDGFQQATGTTTLTSTTGWYHIVAIFDYANNKLISYINGVLDVNASVSFGSSTSNYSANVYMFANLLSTTTYWFDGKIDEVGIWSRVLTATEITELYNSGAGLQYPFGETPTAASNTIFFSSEL